MTRGSDINEIGDKMFREAWAAFADDDATTGAPASLEARVREAARLELKRRHARQSRQQLLMALGAAAVLALVIQQGSPPSVNRDAHDGLSTADSIVQFPVARSRPDALVMLAVDPVEDTEQLALVHIRVTQDSLLALGIATGEASESRLVDVEVLVGGDGLPRDIRSIRTVHAAERRD